MKKLKLLKKALGKTDNLRFGEMVTLVEAFGFELKRVTGSHHIFAHPRIPDLLNLQNRKGKAKPYQIKQFVDLVDEYRLDVESEE